MKRRAQGSLDGTKVRLAIGFPPNTFATISKLAERHEKSFSEMVVSLCRHALEGGYNYDGGQMWSDKVHDGS